MKRNIEMEPISSQHRGRRRRPLSAIGLTLLICLGLIGGQSLAACADEDSPFSSAMPAVAAPARDDAADTANSGPVRMARFSYLSGDVTWRGGSDGDWSSATRNLPLRQGAQIWVSDGGRAEIQFDDGSYVRLDSNTLITLQTLYSDTEGEFTEITLNDGQVYLRLKSRYSLYQVNSPEASLKAAGPARLRVGAGEGAQFAVHEGSATIDGANGKVTLQQGDYLDVVDNTTPYNVGPLPGADAWDAWNDNRDRHSDEGASSHVPPNIALVSGDLDDYGNWHDDSRYGWVWAPRQTDPDWRPYSAGHWTWVEPFGWTWVADEPWGWAPYHYGTWVHEPYGWAWCPGPAVQYWSPAVVSFCQVGTRVAWCPLAPREVVYPSTLAIGFRSGNWSLFFSIGSAAVYYPTAEHVCVARPWATHDVNHVTYVNQVTNITNVTNITVNHNTYVNTGFVPTNARFQGGSQVEALNFAANRTAYRPVASTEMSVFTRGQAIGAPVAGHPVAGPQSVPVTRQALTPMRTFRPQSTAPQEIVNRSVYRATLPANVPRTASAPLPGQRFINRYTPPTRPTNIQPGRTNPGPGNTGRSSALDQYLRERDAARGGGSGNPNGNPNRYVPNNQGTGGTGNNVDRSTGAPPRDYNRNDGSQYNPQRDYNRGGAPQSNSARRDYGTGQPGRTAPTYRPLHTRPTDNSGQRGNGSRSNGGNNNGKNGSDRSDRTDRSGGDRGH